MSVTVRFPRSLSTTERRRRIVRLIAEGRTARTEWHGMTLRCARDLLSMSVDGRLELTDAGRRLAGQGGDVDDAVPYVPGAYCPEFEDLDLLDCCACTMGVCSHCGHEDCPSPAHGRMPGHGENGVCLGCDDCDDAEDDL